MFHLFVLNGFSRFWNTPSRGKANASAVRREPRTPKIAKCRLAYAEPVARAVTSPVKRERRGRIASGMGDCGVRGFRRVLSGMRRGTTLDQGEDDFYRGERAIVERDRRRYPLCFSALPCCRRCACQPSNEAWDRDQNETVFGLWRLISSHFVSFTSAYLEGAMRVSWA